MCLGASKFSLRSATELVYIGLKEGATSESWSQVQPEKKPKDRVFHTAVYYEGFMWIFGGAMQACADKKLLLLATGGHLFEKNRWSTCSFKPVGVCLSISKKFCKRNVADDKSPIVQYLRRSRRRLDVEIFEGCHLLMVLCWPSGFFGTSEGTQGTSAQ
jgi:hypothetical protein